MPDPALNVAQVLWEERMALARPRESSAPLGIEKSASKAVAEAELNGRTENQPESIADIYRRLNKDNHWALCLSGGGIRSAAFALGVLQRFGDQPMAPKCGGDAAGSLLQQFEYLSTVSGGGYIGSWLSAWLFQERKKRAAQGKEPGGANDVVAALNDRMKDYEEVEPISNLRRNTHYLAPSFSPISPDLWSDIAGVGRNLCLNWILLVPPMILAVLTTKAMVYAFIASLEINEHTVSLALGMATICFVIALSFSVANRPSRGLINASQPQFLVFDMAIFLAGAWLLAVILGGPDGPEILSHLIHVPWIDQIQSRFPSCGILCRGAALGAGIYFTSWFIALLWKAILRQAPQPQLEQKPGHAWVDLVTWCIVGAVFGALTAAGFLLLTWIYAPGAPHTANPEMDFQLNAIATLVVVCGVPWVISARLIADVVFIAFADLVPGIDAGLEYQARSGGILTLAQLGWLIWFGLVLWAPPVENWLQQSFHGWATASLAAAGGISGAFSVIAGASSKTAAIVQKASGLRRYLSLNTLAAVAAAIFAIVLVAALSIGIDWAFSFTSSGADPKHPSWALVWTVGSALAALVALASLVININRYSLHSIYRNRLVRAFLGASRVEGERDETKNRFTDFDSLDSPLLHELWATGNPRGDNWRPLHVINAALNLVSSKNLAWQERMAAPFTFSPLHCGSGSSIFSGGAYRATQARKDQRRPYGARLGLTLGTAMAISGAAVSPNMGYNTSPGVAFLMTLFNVRLGWWLANPRADNRYYWDTSPRVALRPYFMEMFGLTSETERWVYLSDGGHFENLGIYEMVRRRCRIIVVSDAGCDPDYMFDDLGNALRKIWIDLGVRIEMNGLDRLKKRFKKRPTPATQEPYWAVGRIRYNDADGEGTDGLLLYLKSGLHGTEPMDVLSYAMAHPAFPHETTANQFFTESQFESYRMLGFEIAGRALESGGCSPLERVTPADGAAPRRAATADLTLDLVIKHLETQLSISSTRA
jgi:hypothetical protein